METNIVLCGVGGQGILSISIALDLAAVRLGWDIKQAEVHGMSQRGGEVVSHLRYADHPVRPEVIPRGKANLVLSVEPLEALRYVTYLSPECAVATSADPLRTLPPYPDPGAVAPAGRAGAR
ncbi:indolepyruvate oxidoreductase, partial [bacterium]|nr:indolepyruvate oxidoreductase [bacterium]